MADQQVISPQYEEKLNAASKEQLIKFMIEMGSRQKQTQCQVAKYLTQDKLEIDDLINQLQNRILYNQERYELLKRQKDNLELETGGLELAITVVNEKLKKRQTQLSASQAAILKQEEETEGMIKLLTPKLFSELNKALKSSSMTIKSMTDTFIGLLRQSKQVDDEDLIKVLGSHAAMVESINSVKRNDIPVEVLEFHLDNIKKMTKNFTDASAPDYHICSKFQPFIGFSSQYIILCRHSQEAIKVQLSIVSIEKDLEQKKLKKTKIQSVVSNFNEEGIADFFKKCLDEDENKLKEYQDIRQKLTDEAGEEQYRYFNFEKLFFTDLEKVVIDKKKKK